MLATPIIPISPPAYICQASIPMPDGKQAKGATVVAGPDKGLILLRDDLCARIRLLEQGARPRSMRWQLDFSEAVFVLGHERCHLGGIMDERQADVCAADAPAYLGLARGLGVPLAFARVLYGYVVTFIRH